MAKPKLTGLGRGLDAILVDSDYSSGDSISSVRINDVEPNKNQPRKVFQQEELEALSDSIVKYGVISPITVRQYILCFPSEAIEPNSLISSS